MFSLVEQFVCYDDKEISLFYFLDNIVFRCVDFYKEEFVKNKMLLWNLGMTEISIWHYNKGKLEGKVKQYIDARFSSKILGET